MFSRQNLVDYLARISRHAKQRARETEVEREISANGFWEDHQEWRISTVTTTRIEAIDQNGKQWFKVTVSTDASMTAHCPTIARAVEFAGIFERLQQDLFWTVGWPSWAAVDQLEP